MALKACDRSVICSLFLIGTSQILEETDTVSLDHLVIGLCLAQPANHRALFHLPIFPRKHLMVFILMMCYHLILFVVKLEMIRFQ